MTTIQPESHRNKFIEGMSKAACTVNIVTTDGEAGRAGLTVSAMCSVSADPTSLLVCVHAESRSCDIIGRNEVFCVNVLNENQSYISNSFAGRLGVDDKFACAEWYTKATGAPVLKGSLTSFDCKIQHSFKCGSHFIFVGEVVDISVQDRGHPLIYANRAYGRAISLSEDALKAIAEKNDTRKIRLGGYLTISAFFMPALVADYKKAGNTATIDLTEGRQTDLLEALIAGGLDLAVMYLDKDVDGIETRLLFEVPPYALLPGEHPLAKQDEVSLAELAEYPMVSLQSPSGGSGYIDSLFEQAGVTPDKGGTAPSFEVLRGMVGHGLGYAITITKPASNMSYDGAALVRKPISDSLSPARLVLAYKSDQDTDSVAKQFIDFTSQHFAQLKPGGL